VINNTKKKNYKMNAKTNIERTEHGSFTCPVLNHIKELKAEVSELKKLLANTKHPLPPMDNSDLMHLYHISRTTAAEWRSHGLDYIKVGNKLFYRREDIDAFLLRNRNGR
jgi:hypothetical protein